MALGFCQEDGGSAAVDLKRYYNQIFEDSGMKSVIFEKARSIISDSASAQRQGFADHKYRGQTLDLLTFSCEFQY